MSDNLKNTIYTAAFTSAACFSLWQGHLAGCIACGAFTLMAALTLVATT